jgi:hypothetical protein
MLVVDHVAGNPAIDGAVGQRRISAGGGDTSSHEGRHLRAWAGLVQSPVSQAREADQRVLARGWHDLRVMNENRNQGRAVKPQAEQKHPDEHQRDLNPHHLEGQNIGQPSDGTAQFEGTALSLRKQGRQGVQLDDEELKQVPVLAAGERLQQGATYIDLADRRVHEFKATGDMTAQTGHAYVPKDRVPYTIWNRLIGEPKPGQERLTEDEHVPRRGTGEA